MRHTCGMIGNERLFSHKKHRGPVAKTSPDLQSAVQVTIPAAASGIGLARLRELDLERFLDDARHVGIEPFAQHRPQQVGD